LRIVIIASKESGEMETKIGTNMESYVVNYNNISLQEFKSCPFNSFSESNYHFPLPFWLENRSNKRKMLPNSSKCQRKLSQGLSQKKSAWIISTSLKKVQLENQHIYFYSLSIGIYFAFHSNYWLQLKKKFFAFCFLK
jgi:hypothetical protein